MNEIESIKYYQIQEQKYDFFVSLPPTYSTARELPLVGALHKWWND